MKDLLEFIKTRRSIRKYKPDMVPKDLIEQIIEAGTYAPTGKNMQTPVIIAVTNRELRDKLAKVNCEIGGWKEGFDPFYGAPVILIVLADKASPNHVYDGALVMENLMLAAHALGLGTCWINRAREEFERPEWKQWLEELGISGDYEGIGHCALGYMDGEAPQAGKRKENWAYFVE